MRCFHISLKDKIFLETFPEYLHDIAGFAHCVEVYCWYSIPDEVFALHRTPFCSNAIDGFFVVFYLCYRLGEFNGDVEGECFREHCDLSCCGQWFESGDDRYCDSCFAAAFHKVVVDFVVKEHLSDDVVCSGVDFSFEVVDIGLNVSCFKVFFRVASYSYAEVSVGEGSWLRCCCLLGDVAVSAVGGAALIFADAFYQFTCIPVAARCWCESFFTDCTVASECYYIADSEEFQIVESALDFFFGVASADQVWDHFYVIFRHDC